jgi:hypothetical protein
MTYQLWGPLSLVSYGMCPEALSLWLLRSGRHTDLLPILSAEVTFTVLCTREEKIHLYPLLFICLFSIIIIIIIGGVWLSPRGTAATTGLLYKPQMIYDSDCGEIGGM